MPETAENVAELLNISRADQDAFALRSQQRTARAQQNGVLAQEIVPVLVPGKKGPLRRSLLMSTRAPTPRWRNLPP